MAYRDLVKSAYTAQKGNAKYRGIPFLLTYEQWCTVWMESGKWEQRGSRRGQYVMARPGDKGAYEIGNVMICLAEENRAERNRNYPMQGESNPNYGKNPWALFKDPEGAKEKKRQAMKIVAARKVRDARGWFTGEEI